MFKVPDWGNDVPKSDIELTKLFVKKNNKKTSKSNSNAIDNSNVNGKKKNLHGIEKRNKRNKSVQKMADTKKLSKTDHIKQRMLKRNLKILNAESKNKHNSDTSLNKVLLQKDTSHADKTVVINENAKNKINLTHNRTKNGILQGNGNTVSNKSKKPRKRKHPQIDKKPPDTDDGSVDNKSFNAEKPYKVLPNAKRNKRNAKVQNNDVEVTPLATANGKTTISRILADNSSKKIRNQSKNSIRSLNEINSNKGNEIETSNKERKIRKKKEQLKEILKKNIERSVVHTNGNTLRIRMMERLKAAQFRYINEKLYTSTGEESQDLFRSDPTAFQAYHEGYQQQVKKWPVNPLDLIVKRIQSMPKTHVIADMGCGEAALSRRVGQRVHSIDLVAAVPGVLAADMAHTPLSAASVDVAVYCLALMGTDLASYLLEANRVLKMGGHLLIAEVESRFENAEAFSSDVQRLGFSLKKIDKSHHVFFFLEFTKVRDAPTKKHKLPVLSLKPCLYKRR